MAARRLIIVLVLLLAVSVAAAALAPQRTRETTTPEEAESSTAPDSEGDGSGELVERGIIASPKDPETIDVEAGDRVILSITTREPREIEIAAFGLIGNADPVAPAQFDFLTIEPVRAPITDTSNGEVLGRVVVAEPKSGSQIDPK
jgi:hypothetical protein